MKRKSRILALILCAAMLVGIMAGCTKPADTNGGSSAPPATSPSPGGEASPSGGAEAPSDSAPAVEGISLSMAITEDVKSVDPTLSFSQASMQMVCLVTEGLMTFGTQGEVVCGVAESYDVSADGLTYTFKLRDDVYWTNGDQVTSKDFLFSWQRLVDPATGAIYAFMLGTCGVKNAFDVAYGGADMSTLGISAPDDFTFVVELDAPRSYFLYLLALSSFFMPINEAYLNECGDQFGLDKDHYIANGPYVFSEWEVGGTSYTLVKNPGYYAADKVDVEEITFSVITDSQQMMMGWDMGTLDTVGLSGDYVEMYKDDPGLEIYDMAAMFFLSFNTSDSNLASHNLRMALSLAIDKQAIVDNILRNGSRVADYIIPAVFAVDSKGVTYRDRIGNPTFNEHDKAKAAGYWEAAKAELGVDNLTLDLLYNEDSTLSAVSAFLQSEWQSALPGLTINLVQTTYNNRLDLMAAHDYQIGLTRWFADYQDALTYLDMWISSSQMNYGLYNNPEYDALYQQVVGELALKEDDRIAAQAQMEAMILGDAAICPLYQLAACVLLNPDYNWVRNVAGVIQYKWVTWK